LRKVTLAALILVAGGGCGYTTVATPTGHAPSIAVPLFENRTFEPLLDVRITERVKSRLVATGPWRLVNRPGTADLVVRGVVTALGVTPVSFDRSNRVLEQRVTITAQITADRRDQAAAGPAFQGTVTGTSEYSEVGDTLQIRAAKNRAIEEAGDLLAQDLVARLLSLERLEPPSGPTDRPTPSPMSAPPEASP